MRRHGKALSSKIGVMSVGASVAIFLGGQAARGSLMLEVMNSTATAGGTGSFDIAFTDSGGGDVVGTFTLDVSVGGSGVTFTSANTGTNPSVDPYIFGSIQSPPFTQSSFPNTHFVAGDTDLTIPFEVTFNGGDIAGAAAVAYSVAPGTPSGQVPVTLGVNTHVGDASGGPVDFTKQNGTITIIGASTAHAIISLTSSAPTGYGSQVTAGSGGGQGTFSPNNGDNKLDLTGTNGNYKLAQATNIGGSTATAYAEAHGFNPNSNTEIFALDVTDTLGQATSTELSALLSAINGTDGVAPASNVTASLSAPTPDGFSSKYNIFLTFSGAELPSGLGTPGDDFLGFDISHANDSNLTGLSVSAVAVVPEPVSIGIMGLAGLGLLQRRRILKA